MAQNSAGAARQGRDTRTRKPTRARTAPAVWTVKNGFRHVQTPSGRVVVVEENPRMVEAKQAFLDCMLGGYNVKQSLEAIGRKQVTLEKWRRTDAEFRDKANAIRDRGAQGVYISARTRAEERSDRAKALSYADFSERFLRQRVFPHTQNVIDLIEGGDPTWLHPSMTYQPGERDLIVVNMPPEHAKTTSITINYVVNQIVKDPSIKVLIVSKSQTMAKKMLLAVKSRLTSPQYHGLIAEFAPDGGFDTNAAAWTADMIYIGGDLRDAEQKDPTVQALGLRGHIYGARADLIILDDVVALDNAHEFDKQIEWIQSEVISRLSSNGTLLVVGTRLAPRDLYMELLDPRRYPEERCPWTYLAMPAVLEFAEEPEQWVTLWPRGDRAERGEVGRPDADGLYPKWDGPRLHRKRARLAAGAWARVYQQQQTTEDTVFDPDAVSGCQNGARLAGPLPRIAAVRQGRGMDGLVRVAGLDPATAGHSAFAVVGLDPPEGKRFVLDVRNRPSMKPDEIRDMIYHLTDQYQIVEWVIETNGFQGFLAHDREVNEFLAARGCLIRPHFTGNVKHDPDFGVAAMSGLFKGWQTRDNLIELPSSVNSEGVKALVEQLCTWAPQMGKRQKTDAVMALWMAELACIRRIEAYRTFGRRHATSQFHTAYDRRMQRSYNLTEIEMASRG